MPTVAQIEAFALAHVKDKTGRPFRTDGPFAWVKDEFWRPLRGFKWWPLDAPRLCDACSRRANTITEWTWDGYTAQLEIVDGNMRWTPDPEHLGKFGCAGLRLSPVLFVLLKLHRRMGKTLGFAAIAEALAAILPNQFATYLAVSEDQSGSIFEDNFAYSCRNDPDLADATRIVGNEIQFVDNGSRIEYIPTSAGSGTGGGSTLLGFDECRDVPHEVFTQIVPRVTAERGMECPNGHVHVGHGVPHPERCPVCQSRLQPWFARVVAMSNAGTIKESAWFSQLVASVLAEPDESAHAYDSARNLNPMVSAEALGAVGRMFSRSPTLKHAVAIEIENVDAMPGEDYLTPAEVNLACNSALANLEGSALPCVGHLDCSLNTELTSLVVLADVGIEQGEEPWSWLSMARLDFWDPRGKESGALAVPGGQIDETIVMPLFDHVMPLFPGLRKLTVDTRGHKWPNDFVRTCRTTKPWGHKIESLQRKAHERDTAFSDLEERVRAKSAARGVWPRGKKAIELFDHVTLRREFAAARKHRDTSGRQQVREYSRRQRHLDLVDSIAMACYIAFLISLEKRQSLAAMAAGPETEAQRILRRIHQPVASSILPRGRDPGSAF